MSAARNAAIVLLIVSLSVISPNLVLAAPISTKSTIPSTVATYNYKILSSTHAVSGVQSALVILMEFQDVHHTKTPEQMKSVALDQLNSYYSEVSYGKISITGQIFGWYTAPHSMGYYGHDNSKPGDDDNLDQLARDAVALLPSSADLSSFKYLVVVHAGQDQAADQDTLKSNEIWSQCECAVFPRYDKPSQIYARGKSFSQHTFLSEFNGVGTFAHEWGHMLGLPDLYDTSKGDSYLGYWSLMDSGNWCCPNDNQVTPSYIGAWGDTLLGWLSPSIADATVLLSAFDLKPLESPQATAVLIPLSSNTYYFLEYRAKTGRDSALPSAGAIIYFVDETRDTGQGILRLVNPATGNLYAAQERTSALNDPVFKASDEFRDLIHQVYVAFVGGTDVLTTLYSKQEFKGSFMQTNLQTSPTTMNGLFSDQITLTGTLLAKNGIPLGGQNIELDVLDRTSLQWKRVGNGTTDQLGDVSVNLSLKFDVGSYALRLFYPGGRSGSVWYTSTSTEFTVQVSPAKMTVTSSPTSVAVGAGSVFVLVTGLHGEPLSGVTVTVYVGSVQVGVVTTDKNGKANLALQFGLMELGPRTITVKASTANYAPAEASGNIILLPIWLIAAIIATIAAAAAVSILMLKRSSRLRRSN